MKVLITGGGGFLGGWIVRRLLAGGHTLRIFDRSAERNIVREIAGPVADEIEWVRGDITDAEAVSAAASGCDVVIHLAAVLTPACKSDPIRGAQINLIGTLNVFEAAKRHKLKRVIYASSAGVFGPDNGAVPWPTTHYGAFKLACEGCARAYWEDVRMPSVGFRPFVVYGPGREVGLSAGPTLACKAAARQEPYEIGFTGESDLIFVDDVAAAFEAAALASFDGARVFNLLGELATVDEVIAEVERQVPGAAITANGPPLPTNAHITPSELEPFMPGLPRTRLKEGIARTIEHYRHAGHGRS